MNTPKNILLIKAHSMGIGDLLRSSAAWQVLKNRWPHAHLHLLMLCKKHEHATEPFIRSHHLLSSATFIACKEQGAGNQYKRVSTAALLEATERQLDCKLMDLIIDFEPNGINTSLLAHKLTRKHNAVSVGIAQFPLRRYFYDKVSPSTRRYLSHHQLQAPMDYTERDFVALQCLALARGSTRIQLCVSPQGLAWRSTNAASFASNTRHVLLNIGCGTPDALVKRPSLAQLADAMVALYEQQSYTLHLSGADFEKEVNTTFLYIFNQKLSAIGQVAGTHNWAGKCTLSELTGLLSQTHLVVSSDSGPYHMAVALGIPTLCWYNFATPASHHNHADVASLVMPTTEVFTDAALELLKNSIA